MDWPTLAALLLGGTTLTTMSSFGTWCLVALLKGRLIPYLWVERMRAQDAIRENDLRDARDDALKALKIREAQVDQLIQGIGTTATRTFEALPKPPPEET